MALADTARLIASLELKDLFSPKVAQIDKSLGKLSSGIDHTASRSYRAGQQIGTGIKVGAAIAAGAVGLLATNVALGLKSLEELETVTTQTNAVLKSTKGAAGQTADSIRNLAEKYENLNATIDDKVIQSGENVLLTFTNIRKEAFEPALQAALNLSTAMGQDLQSSVVQLGKALNDPVKGITALTRVGVSFDDQQKKQIKTLVGEGKTLEAQKIILAELNKEFGGSFLAGGQTTAGKVAKFRDAIEDLQKALATALLPVIGKVADALSRFLADPKVVAGISKLGQNIAGLFSDANLAKGADFLKSAFATAVAAAPVVEAAAKATLGFVQGAVAVFKQLPPELQGLLAGGFALNKITGGLVTNIGGGIVGAILGKLRSAVVNVQGAVVNVNGGIPGIGGAVGAAEGGAVGAAEGVAAESLAFKTGKIIGAAINLSIAGAIIAAAVPIGKAFADALPDFLKGPGGRGASDSQLAHERAQAAVEPVKQTDFSALLNANAREDRNALHADLGALGGKITDDLGGLKDTLKGVGAEFTSALKQLQHPKTPAELKHAAAELTKLVTQGHGDAKNTDATLKSLKAQVAKTHDAKLAASLRADIAKVAGLLPGRQFAAHELATAKQILGSNKTATEKIKELKSVEQALKDRGLPHAADRIRQKEEEVRNAAKTAGTSTADAIRRKKLSTEVNVTVPVTTYVSVRDVTKAVTKLGRWGVQVT